MDEIKKSFLPGDGKRKLFLCIITVLCCTFLVFEMINKNMDPTFGFFTIICVVGFFFGANVVGDHFGKK
jgi:hypothetical protein